MLTFQPIDLLIVLIAGVVLVVGLSFLALRRRNELLQDYLTPEEPDIEQEFFKKREIVETPAEQEPETVEAEEVDPMAGATWGIPGDQ